MFDFERKSAKAQKELRGKTAVYFDGNKETKSSPVAYELDKAKDLWDTSVELTGITPWW